MLFSEESQGPPDLFLPHQPKKPPPLTDHFPLLQKKINTQPSPPTSSPDEPKGDRRSYLFCCLLLHPTEAAASNQFSKAAFSPFFQLHLFLSAGLLRQQQRPPRTRIGPPLLHHLLFHQPPAAVEQPTTNNNSFIFNRWQIHGPLSITAPPQPSQATSSTRAAVPPWPRHHQKQRRRQNP